MVSYSDVRTIGIAPVSLTIDLTLTEIVVPAGEKHSIISFSSTLPGFFKSMVNAEVIMSYSANPSTISTDHFTIGYVYFFQDSSSINLNDPLDITRRFENFLTLERVDLTYRSGSSSWIGDASVVMFKSTSMWLNVINLRNNTISGLILCTVMTAPLTDVVLKSAGSPGILKIRFVPSY